MALNMARVWCRCSSYCIKKNNFPSVGVNFFHLSRSVAGYERDPAPLFFSPDVQRIMRKMTKVDVKKVFRSRKLGEKLDAPEYKFLTSEELEQYMKETEKKVEERLQVPPIVKEREEINEVLSVDRALTGYDSAKFVFTDITFGVPNKDRVIVVREPDGTLRKAFWNERFRMNQIYFPEPDRQLRTPHMFEEPYLTNVLDRGEYEFVLDRACVQYEPNDPEYYRITSTTYDHIEKEQMFDALQSTRHFGALAFYLCWNKQIDNFVLYYIQNDRIEDAVMLIQLFHLLNPESKSAETDSKDALKFIQAYISKDSTRKSVLEIALQSFLELQKQRQFVEEGIKKAHGM
ncbi:28S ribosomal protein S22, mitochondrial [Gryllus bimaculatus]|nr:28S ribosomal protein S22, mitochondrial [Gryllus bimaculatus]